MLMLSIVVLSLPGIFQVTSLILLSHNISRLLAILLSTVGSEGRQHCSAAQQGQMADQSSLSNQ